MRRGTRITTATILGLAAALTIPATGFTQNDLPPRGNSYWINDEYALKEVVVLKYQGKRLRVGWTHSPCFTGIRKPGRKFVGGGYNQGGGYSHQTLRLRINLSGRIGMRWSALPQTNFYQRYTRKAALKFAKQVGLRYRVHHMFRDCELR